MPKQDDELLAEYEKLQTLYEQALTERYAALKEIEAAKLKWENLDSQVRRLRGRMFEIMDELNQEE